MMSKQYTPGPWIWQNSCSWWRLGTLRGDGYILRPAVMKDGWPTIDFPSGGPTGADAKLIERAPDMANRLSHYEQYVMERPKDAPNWAILWHKTAQGLCWWMSEPFCTPFDTNGAPDYRPDEPGPLTMVVVPPMEE